MRNEACRPPLNLGRTSIGFLFPQPAMPQSLFHHGFLSSLDLPAGRQVNAMIRLRYEAIFESRDATPSDACKRMEGRHHGCAGAGLSSRFRAVFSTFSAPGATQHQSWRLESRSSQARSVGM